jgi:hypothetical protein
MLRASALDLFRDRYLQSIAGQPLMTPLSSGPTRTAAPAALTTSSLRYLARSEVTLQALSVFATSWSGIAARTLRYANCDLQVRLDSSVIVLSRRNKRELWLSNASIPWLWPRSCHTNFIKMSSYASCIVPNQIGLTGNRLLRCKPLPEQSTILPAIAPMSIC